MNEAVEELMHFDEINKMKKKKSDTMVYNTTAEIFCMNVSDGQGNEVELARIEPDEGICQKKFQYIANKLKNWVVYKTQDESDRVYNTTKKVFETKILDGNDMGFDYARIGPGEHIDGALFPKTARKMMEWMQDLPTEDKNPQDSPRDTDHNDPGIAAVSQEPS